MMPATLIRLRITLSLIIAIVLTLGTAALIIDRNVDREVAERADANLLERARALADVFSTAMKFAPQSFQSHHVPSFLADSSLVYFAIHCRGQQVVSSDEAARLPWPAPINGQPLFARMKDSHGVRLHAVVLRFSPERELQRSPTVTGDAASTSSISQAVPDCDLGLAASRHEVRHFQEYMDQIEIGCVVVGFLAVLVLVPLLATRGLRPLSRLADEMSGIGPDNPEKRLGETSALELRPLVTRFNEVLSRMEDGLTRERQFASGVAHELRTPLAELRTGIEVELRYPSGRDLHTLLADIRDIGMEMEQMVAALLLLTRIEAGIEKLQVQAVDVTALTQRLIERHQKTMQDRQISLQADIQPGVTWQADTALLDVVLSNLLGNAVAYAPIGSCVTLQCVSHRWCVKNLAPDLTEQDVERMGQRFWRKGKDAGVNAGLGLALASAAARAQSIRLDLALEGDSLQASISCGGKAP
jgi:two-component system, OmpR family, sensor histidine kinase QseC